MLFECDLYLHGDNSIISAGGFLELHCSVFPTGSSELQNRPQFTTLGGCGLLQMLWQMRRLLAIISSEEYLFGEA